MNIEAFREKAIELDTKDRLKRYQHQFVNSDRRMIYLDGNSLGRLPVETAALLENIIQHQWGERLIRSWNENWLDLSKRIAEKIARLIGAEPDEVFVGDSTSINLYKLAFGALSTSRGKKYILTDDLNFPSDRYILEGMIAGHFPEMKLQTVKSRNDIDISMKEIEKYLSSDIALISLSHVAYKSSFMYPIESIAHLAHQAGALVLWDFSHSVGAVPIQVKESHVDLAVGCTYKYLNGGPGAPAFCYVRRDLQNKIKNPIWGWFGHNQPFKFEDSYSPRNSADQFAVGTPGILSLAAVEPGVNCLLEAGMISIREKSLQQSRFLIELFDTFLAESGFTLGSPREESKRGSHITLKHPEAYRISRAMIDPTDDESFIIIPDFRPPDNLRLGIAPLYISFVDIFNAVLRMKTIVREKIYESYGEDHLTVP